MFFIIGLEKQQSVFTASIYIVYWYTMYWYQYTFYINIKMYINIHFGLFKQTETLDSCQHARWTCQLRNFHITAWNTNLISLLILEFLFTSLQSLVQEIYKPYCVSWSSLKLLPEDSKCLWLIYNRPTANWDNLAVLTVMLEMNWKANEREVGWTFK